MPTSTLTSKKGTDAELPANHDRDDVDGGTLVYELEREDRTHMGREVVVCRTLVGFASVSDWDGVRNELVKRGHDVGAIHYLPEFDTA